MNAYRPIQGMRLGQFSAYINPFEVTGDQTPMTPPSPGAPPPNPVKTVMVLSGLGATALSAATAYVGVKYGMNKGNKDFQRALGWTVGVVGALSGIVRLIGTGALLLVPASPVPAQQTTTMAGKRY